MTAEPFKDCGDQLASCGLTKGQLDFTLARTYRACLTSPRLREPRFN